MRISHKAGGAMAIHAKVENQLVFNGDGTLSSATKPDLKNAPAETLATIGAVREMNRMPLFFQGIHNGTRESLIRVFNGSATPNDAIQISALTHPELVKAVLRGDVATVAETTYQADPYQRGKWSRGTAYLDGQGKPQGWVRTPDLNQAMPDSLPPPFARGGADAKAGSIGKDTMRNIKGRFNPLVYGNTSHTGPDGAIRTLVAGRNNVSGATGQGIGQEDMEFDASKALPEGHTGTEFAPWHVYGVSYSITSNGVFNEGAVDAEQVAAQVLALQEARENEVGQLEATDTATLTSTDNKIVFSNIVSRVKVEKGDVVRIIASAIGYDKLHTIESIVNQNEVVVNYEHCGARGNGSLKLPDYSGSVTVKRIAKYFNAANGLGQEFVNVSNFRTVNASYLNSTGRVISCSFMCQTITASNITVNGVVIARKDYVAGVGGNNAVITLSNEITPGSTYIYGANGTVNEKFIFERR